MQNDIRTSIKERLEELITEDILVRVGNYPDDIPQIGHNFPSVFVGDGDELWESQSGSQEKITISLPIYTYYKGIKNRITYTNTFNNKVIKKVLGDLSNGGHSVNTQIESVEKGTYEPNTTNYYEPGFYPEITVRKINFLITFYTPLACI